MDLVVVFALFVFMLALLCFCVATVFSVNKDLYKMPYDKTTNFRTNWTNRRTDEHQTVVYTLSAMDAATVIAEN